MSATDRARELREFVAPFDPPPLAERRVVSAARLREFADLLPVLRAQTLKAFALSVDGPYPARRAQTTLTKWWEDLERDLRHGDEQPPDLPAAVPTDTDFIREVLRLEQCARAAADRFCPPTEPASATGAGKGEEPEPAPQFVTLDQMAAMVNRSKDTLERKLNVPDSTMPRPDVEGGGGKPHEWRWDRIRPWLVQEFKRDLPERFPAART